MAGLLDQHIAAITGSGSGIGRAIALGYAREGAQVIALDMNGEAAAETAAAIGRAGGKCHSFVLDVRERDRCRDVAALVDREVGPISIRVNDAGINRRNAFSNGGWRLTGDLAATRWIEAGLFSQFSRSACQNFSR